MDGWDVGRFNICVFIISQDRIDEDITSNSAKTKEDASAVPQVNKFEVGCFNVVG